MISLFAESNSLNVSVNEYQAIKPQGLAGASISRVVPAMLLFVGSAEVL